MEKRVLNFILVFIGVYLVDKTLNSIFGSDQGLPFKLQIVILYFFAALLFKFSSRLATFLGALLLLLTPVLLISNNDSLAESVSTFAYLILVLGVFHAVFEEFFKGTA